MHLTKITNKILPDFILNNLYVVIKNKGKIFEQLCQTFLPKKLNNVSSVVNMGEISL